MFVPVSIYFVFLHVFVGRVKNEVMEGTNRKSWGAAKHQYWVMDGAFLVSIRYEVGGDFQLKNPRYRRATMMMADAQIINLFYGIS